MNKSTLGAIIMTTAIIAGAAELSPKDAAKQAAAATGQSRNDLYHAALVRDEKN